MSLLIYLLTWEGIELGYCQLRILHQKKAPQLVCVAAAQHLRRSKDRAFTLIMSLVWLMAKWRMYSIHLFVGVIVLIIVHLKCTPALNYNDSKFLHTWQVFCLIYLREWNTLNYKNHSLHSLSTNQLWPTLFPGKVNTTMTVNIFTLVASNLMNTNIFMLSYLLHYMIPEMYKKCPLPLISNH